MLRRMAVAIYPGSFDPLTNGHLSLIQRGLQMFDRLMVAMAGNPKKTPLFTVEERSELIREAVQGSARGDRRLPGPVGGLREAEAAST